MAYKDKETLASDTTVQLTAAKLVDTVKAALITARGGNFTYDFAGLTLTAEQGHLLGSTGQIEIPSDLLATFRAIRETPGSGTLYVTYLDRPSNMGNWPGQG